jgi:hypothetical protein
VCGTTRLNELETVLLVGGGSCKSDDDDWLKRTAASVMEPSYDSVLPKRMSVQCYEHVFCTATTFSVRENQERQFSMKGQD